MSAAIHAEFVLTGERAWVSLREFIKAHAPQCAKENRPLRVIVVDEEADRLDEQISAYFWIVGHVADQVWMGKNPRRQFSKEVWHEYFCQRYLDPKEIELPTGQTVLKRASIARGKIGVRAMAKFKQQVEAEAVQELGVQLPARDEQ